MWPLAIWLLLHKIDAKVQVAWQVLRDSLDVVEQDLHWESVKELRDGVPASLGLYFLIFGSSRLSGSGMSNDIILSELDSLSLWERVDVVIGFMDEAWSLITKSVNEEVQELSVSHAVRGDSTAPAEAWLWVGSGWLSDGGSVSWSNLKGVDRCDIVVHGDHLSLIRRIDERLLSAHEIKDLLEAD